MKPEVVLKEGEGRRRTKGKGREQPKGRGGPKSAGMGGVWGKLS